MEKQPSSLTVQQEQALVSSPKIQEYIDRVKNGEAITAFGEIPDSWKKVIEKETAVTVTDQERIAQLKQEIVAITSASPEQKKIAVEDELRLYLLGTVEKRFTKDIARKVARDNIQAAGKKELYSIALEQFYQEGRIAEYDRANPLFEFDTETVTAVPNALIKRVQDENGWHYRIPTTGTTAGKSKDRISLNVWANKQLVAVLDQVAHKYGVYYKTPAQSDSWNERNDPVTIYLNNPALTSEQITALKNDIIQETKPYIRSNKGFGIYGENSAPGVEFGPESSPEEIQRLKKEAQQINDELYQAFDQYLQKEGKEKSSVGMNLAAQKLLHLFK